MTCGIQRETFNLGLKTEKLLQQLMTEMTVSYLKLKGKGEKIIPKREFLNSNLDFSLRGAFCKLHLKTLAFPALGLAKIIPILLPKTL